MLFLTLMLYKDKEDNVKKNLFSDTWCWILLWLHVRCDFFFRVSNYNHDRKIAIYFYCRKIPSVIEREYR